MDEYLNFVVGGAVASFVASQKVQIPGFQVVHLPSTQSSHPTVTLYRKKTVEHEVSLFCVCRSYEIREDGVDWTLHFTVTLWCCYESLQRPQLLAVLQIPSAFQYRDNRYSVVLFHHLWCESDTSTQRWLKSPKACRSNCACYFFFMVRR